MISDAFNIISPYPPKTQENIDRFLLLKAKQELTVLEQQELSKLKPLTKKVLSNKDEGSLDYRIQSFLEEKLKTKKS